MNGTIRTMNTDMWMFTGIAYAPNGCWEWLGRMTEYGYGQTKKGLAHRVFYERFYGKIPRELVLDHLCRNRICVNPEHLEAVTDKVNNLRGFGQPALNKRKTHCVRGHELSGRNLMPWGVARGYRICRACNNTAKARTPNFSQKEYYKEWWRQNGAEQRAKQKLKRDAKKAAKK